MKTINARELISAYIDNINADNKTGETTEHSFRGALQTLLRTILNDGIKNDKDKISVINEPKRKPYGAPDFEFRRNDVPISFLETKDLGDKDLMGNNEKRHKGQFDRYKEAITTIAFTDYLTFVLFENGEPTLSATIGKNEGNDIVITSDEQQISLFLQIIAKLGDARPQPIHSARLLAVVMAAKTKIIANVLNRGMEKNETSEDNALHNKLQAFQKLLVHNMTMEQFTDFYAQTIVYGLFVARIYNKTPQTFSLQKAADLIPTINPFLKQIFKHLALADLHSSVRWIVEDLVAIFRVTDIHRVMRNYGKDPLVHFYEEFLEQYNPKIKEDFGVWYTPKDVVHFIVNAVDDILQKDLNIEGGLANNSTIFYNDQQVHRVQVLDPATGTGTFLAMTAEKIREQYKGQEGLWPEDVVKHIIPRLNGFEYLMAPYTMAHLKLATSLHLDELQIALPDRLQIFLTNSLEEDQPEQMPLDFAKFITDESNAANCIKRDMPIMVVMGNPPYNEKSANIGTWITDLMNDYKQEPGQTRKSIRTDRKGNPIYKNTLKETNPKGLNNDYCKFIRLGQNFVEKTQEGILAYICGNTFLDTPLFRGMRYELLQKFDDIYIINLHGSTKRHETTETGERDECVFNIQVGVSINIFIKHKNGHKGELAKVHYKDIYGTRREKLEYLATHKLREIDFEELTLLPPMYTFRRRDPHLKENYDRGFKISDLMKDSVQGFKTDKDYVAIQHKRESVDDIVNAMKSNNEDKSLRNTYGFRDNRDWQLAKARMNLTRMKDWGKDVAQVIYRPFDIRWTLFNKVLVTYPRPLIQKSIHNHANFVLCLGKLGSTVGENEWTLAFITTLPTDINLIPRGGVYLFPLYIYNEAGEKMYVNFSPNIIRKIEEKTGLHQQQDETSEREEGGFLPLDLIDYIYAVLHSRLYRQTYHECLQEDFPTIPYPMSAEYFFQMAVLGSRIRKAHLLEGISPANNTAAFRIPGDNIVTKRKFEETDDGIGRVWINDTQYFDDIPTVAWEMIVAGYQPMDRWLKDRTGKRLTNDEINHYRKMVVALLQQEEAMSEIDDIIHL